MVNINALWEEHGNAARAAARSLSTDKTLQEDLQQEAFFGFLKAIESHPKTGPIKRWWILNNVRWHCFRFAKQAKRTVTQYIHSKEQVRIVYLDQQVKQDSELSLHDVVVSAEWGPSKEFPWAWAQETCTKGQYEALLAHYGEGQTLVEIAAPKSVTREAINRQVARGKARLLANVTPEIREVVLGDSRI